MYIILLTILSLSIFQEKLVRMIITIFVNFTHYALQKYYNAQSVLNHSQKNYEVAYLRYDTGFISFYELLNEKYNFFISQNEATALKYELWFKKILIENYMNGGLVNGYKLD